MLYLGTGKGFSRIMLSCFLSSLQVYTGSCSSSSFHGIRVCREVACRLSLGVILSLTLRSPSSSSPPDLQDPLHSKLPVLGLLAAQQGEQDTLGVGVPCSCPDIGGDYILDLRIATL